MCSLRVGRREFVAGVVAAGVCAGAGGLEPGAPEGFEAAVAAALEVLRGNVQRVPWFERPVLFEGSTYKGTWQECGPHESLVYAWLEPMAQARGLEPEVRPLEVARNTHEAFFTLQREDGQLPSAVKASEVGFGQIQMVVPIAATAWEVAGRLKDEGFLARAYAACGRWDAWLRRYRNTRGTGLVEGFCTYDTGMDNSPRWAGVPNRCPDADARRFQTGVGVPRLCPDLSATVFGARVALAKMAAALGRGAEAQRWVEDAERLRGLIVEKLWCAEDAAFYDVDTAGKFVKVRSCVLMRVLGEHVLRLEVRSEREMFEAMWTRQVHNPRAFWGQYPLTSVAMDDAVFVRPIPRNSWGGASQALTALRTLRWMDHYGQGPAQCELMGQWCRAVVRDFAAAKPGFRQQMDPETGLFTQPDPGGYSPAALVLVEFGRRLGWISTADGHG